MDNRLFKKVQEYKNDKDLLTLWMNNLVVIYAFMLPISQTIKATVFTFIVLLFIVRGDLVKHIKKSLENKVVRAFLYLFAAYAIGLLWTENMSSGISALKSVKYGLYLIVFYAIVDGRYIKKVVGAFILGMLISELTSYGIILNIMPWKLEIGKIIFYSAPSLYDPSPFLNHIHYGVALSFVVILIGEKIFSSESTILVKILISAFILTATANIFITGGRTGYITYILLMLVLSIFYLKKWAIPALLSMLLVLGIAYNTSPIFKQKVHQTQNAIGHIFSENPNFSSSLGQRAGIYFYSLEVLQENPLIGVGTGDSMGEILQVTPTKWTAIHSLSHEHNQYLSILLKLGILGLLVFLNIFYQIFRYEQEDKILRFIQIFATLAIGFGILTTQFNLRFFMPLWVVMLAVTMIPRTRQTISNKIENALVLKQIIIAGTIFSCMSLGNQLLN